MLPPLEGCSEVMCVLVVSWAEAASDDASEAKPGGLKYFECLVTWWNYLPCHGPDRRSPYVLCSLNILCLKALYYYILLGSFLLRLGDFGWPQQVWSLLRFRHCRLSWVPEGHVCEDGRAPRRMTWRMTWLWCWARATRSGWSASQLIRVKGVVTMKGSDIWESKAYHFLFL